MYSVADFGRMIDDDARMEAFREAMSKSVRQDSVVLDLGAGTGIMALLACRYGAKRIYAVEPSNALQVARETAAKGGLSDRIVWIQQRSLTVALPEPVDLIVEDMRGALPWCSTHVPDVIDVRKRFLKPGGRIIPGEDVSFCAAVSAHELYGDRILPWRSRVADVDLSPASRYVENAPVGVRFKPEQLLSAPVAWSKIDYLTVTSPNVKETFALEISRNDTAHGLLLWFDAELLPDVKLSNAPGRPKNVYGQLFLPWPRPIEFDKGAVVDVNVRADLVGDDYVWTWETRCDEHHFRQSSFAATPVTPESLARRAAHHHPSLGQEGKVVRFALERMSGTLTLSDLGDELFRAFPKRFRSKKEAFDFAARLSGDYSE
jgi:protein arginine N-methyltransferase 1